MALLDPFYGVRPRGVAAARWMNRVLLTGELAVFGYAEWHLIYTGAPLWQPVLAPLAFLLGVAILNKVVRKFWDLAMVIFYGTTDPELIAQDIYKSQDINNQ